MTEDNKERIQEHYHLSVGDILYKLAIVKDFTAHVLPFALICYVQRSTLVYLSILLSISNPPPPPEEAVAPWFHHKILALPSVT